MDLATATTLWNSLANTMVTDKVSNETPFGQILLSHGLSAWLYPHAGGQWAENRDAAAEFLRKWADAIAGTQQPS